ncbi:MAG TPA: septum formation initiator family protein [Candidatus Angelobacter sp.]|jgi:cell division protein FtsB|nr:septum formation initiator family protein [Candidatus Angelobacter sp.]
MLKNIKAGRELLESLRGKLATAGIVLLLCVVGYHAVFGANGLLVYEQKRRESQQLELQIKSLQQQNSSMELENKALKSDPQTIEKEARERLRYARPGEFVYTLPVAPVTPVRQKK